MKQYNILSNFIDVIVSDFSCPLWRPEIHFDAIITDRKLINIIHMQNSLI